LRFEILRFLAIHTENIVYPTRWWLTTFAAMVDCFPRNVASIQIWISAEKAVLDTCFMFHVSKPKINYVVNWK